MAVVVVVFIFVDVVVEVVVKLLLNSIARFFSCISVLSYFPYLDF